MKVVFKVPNHDGLICDIDRVISKRFGHVVTIRVTDDNTVPYWFPRLMRMEYRASWDIYRNSWIVGMALSDKLYNYCTPIIEVERVSLIDRIKELEEKAAKYDKIKELLS